MLKKLFCFTNFHILHNFMYFHYDEDDNKLELENGVKANYRVCKWCEYDEELRNRYEDYY